jgi:hypothetical protein
MTCTDDSKPLHDELQEDDGSVIYQHMLCASIDKPYGHPWIIEAVKVVYLRVYTACTAANNMYSVLLQAQVTLVIVRPYSSSLHNPRFKI